MHQHPSIYQSEITPFVRVQRGRRYFDPTMNDFREAKYFNPNGPDFDEVIVNDTHIPIMNPNQN